MDGLALLREIRGRRPERGRRPDDRVRDRAAGRRGDARRRLRLPRQAVRARRGRARCSTACSRCRRCAARTARLRRALERAGAARVGEPGDAAGARDGAPGARPRTRPCCSPARAAPARTCWRGRSTAGARARSGRSSPSPARRSPSTCSRASSSATCKGAFTGAWKDKAGPPRGRATAARVFLDEVGELPPRAAGEAAALPRGAPLRARRRHDDDRGRRAHRRRHQSRPRGRGRGRALPRGPLLPPERGRASRCRRCASGARTCPRSPDHLLAMLAARTDRAVLPARSRGARRRLPATAGRATCASW